MNIFFYAAAAARCCGACNYTTCSSNCLSLLTGLPSLKDLRVLPAGSGLNTPVSMELRSGDILILYAEGREEIEVLISFRHIFDTFRIILIVGEEDLVHYGRLFHLNPRYTIALGKRFNILDSVIDRMNSGNDQRSDYARTQQEQDYA